MALQLNPEPLVLADDLGAEPQHPLRQVVEIKTAKRGINAAESNEAKPRIAVLLSVPRVSVADPVVAIKTEPAVTLAIADEPADEPIAAETLFTEDTGEDVALPEPSRMPLDFARGILDVAKSRIHSIDWMKAGQWARRPIVTYSSAIVLLVAIIIAIVARPRDPNSTENPAAAAVAETQPHDEQLEHAESHIADTSHNGQTESNALPNPSDSIAKLPPTSPVSNSDESHLLPWRRAGTSEFTTTPSPAARTADWTIHRNGTVPFPPTRSASQSSTGSTVHPSVSPNVARLEGRIHTPKLSR